MMADHRLPPRVPRGLDDLVDALRRHIRLLQEYRRRAFDEGERDYWGEVAGKLRLLLLPVGRNKPLLMLLLGKFGINPNTISGLGDIPLPEYLNESGYGVRGPDGRFQMLTNADLINIWATQHGSAHEDWSLTQPFDLLRTSGPETDLLRVAASFSLAALADAAIRGAERVFAVVDSPKQLEGGPCA